jgi:hypothetical protein
VANEGHEGQGAPGGPPVCLHWAHSATPHLPLVAHWGGGQIFISTGLPPVAHRFSHYNHLFV